MNKLKIQNFNNLLNYQHYLKNNSLKKRKYKLKNIIFENPVLYKNPDFNIIELNNFENIQIPITVLDIKNTYTIEQSHENHFLFNYDLNTNLLYNFNKILLNYKKKKDNIIKGRIVTRKIKRKSKKKKVVIAFLGLTFSMRIFNLNKSINSININNNKYNFYSKKKKRIFFKNKNIKIKRIIRSYKLRYLNFKIEKNKNNIYFFSRIAYINDIIKYMPIKKLKKRMLLERKKKKSNFSKKEYVKKTKKLK